MTRPQFVVNADRSRESGAIWCKWPAHLPESLSQSASLCALHKERTPRAATATTTLEHTTECKHLKSRPILCCNVSAPPVSQPRGHLICCVSQSGSLIQLIQPSPLVSPALSLVAHRHRIPPLSIPSHESGARLVPRFSTCQLALNCRARSYFCLLSSPRPDTVALEIGACAHLTHACAASTR